MKVAGRIKTDEWTTREQALLDAQAMRERRQSHEGIEVVTLEEACQDVLDSVKGNDGTWRSYHEHFETICEHFGADEPLHAITPMKINEFLTARRAARVRGKPPSERRLRKHLTALGRVFRLATTNGRFAGANPLDRVEKPKAGKRRHQDRFTIDELGEIFRALHKRTTRRAKWDMAVVAALLFTGLRRRGLCCVTKAMIDDKAGFIRGIEQKESLGGLVAISRPLAHVLPTLVEAADETGHLIPKGRARGPRKKDARPRTDNDRRTEKVDCLFADARDDLPETLRARFHPHAMRHSLRTILADAGVPEHIKDAITDHAPSTVGRTYEHATPTNVRAWTTKVLDPLLRLIDLHPEQSNAAAQ